MAECLHQWEMTNIQFGFLAFEKCFHCNSLRTFFSKESNPVFWDEYREENCFWNRVENAQSIMFDLKCTKCGYEESFSDLMGLLFCTGCLSKCEIDVIRRKLEAEKTWIMVAFGFLPDAWDNPIPPYKLDILTEYFNQRRDTSRSKIRIVPFNKIEKLSHCKGEFIHDIGMLSKEPVTDRKHVF